jgi:hypothetical protein
VVSSAFYEDYELNTSCHDAIWKETDKMPTIYHKSSLLELYESMRPEDSKEEFLELEGAVKYEPEQKQQQQQHRHGIFFSEQCLLSI